MKFRFILPVLLSGILLQSCASILTGTRQNIYVTSDPPGARVQINLLPQGTTPAIISVSKGLARKDMMVSKDGYAPKIVRL